jgi:hypothetical protein
MSVKRRVVYLPREPLWESIAKDSYTFGVIAASVWFNENYCGGCWLMNAIILFGLIVLLILAVSIIGRA